MGLLNVLIAKLKTIGKPPFEVEEQKIPVEFGRNQVRVKVKGKDVYLEKCLYDERQFKKLKIKRFYLVSEHPWGLHFAPTLGEALDWFTGRKEPKDGYLSISWGKKLHITAPLVRIKKLSL
jgi:hypothetical protein